MVSNSENLVHHQYVPARQGRGMLGKLRLFFGFRKMRCQISMHKSHCKLQLCIDMELADIVIIVHTQGKVLVFAARFFRELAFIAFTFAGSFHIAHAAIQGIGANHHAFLYRMSSTVMGCHSKT